MLLINPEQVTHIKTHVLCKNQWYRIIPERTTWYGKVVPEYVHNVCRLTDNHYKTINEFLNARPNNKVIDGIIYYKPHIEITLSNGKYIEKYFETIEEMSQYIKEEFSSIKLIIVE
jgi:hypothetical protein